MLLSTVLYSQTGWYQLKSGSTSTLFDIVFPPSGGGNTGYAVGSAGTILATTNAGLNWNTQVSTQGTDLWSAFFINSSTGWAAGANGVVIHTTNGGINWLLQPTPTSFILYSIYFIDIQTGWAVGQQGTILHTTNSGNGWTLQTSTSGDYLRSSYFSSPTDGVAVGRNGRIIKTTDSGNNWFDIQYGNSGPFYDEYFVNQFTGWTVGLYVSMYTTNGGLNWVNQDGSGIFLGVNFPNQSTGWRTGSDGDIQATTNGGVNWMPQTSGVAQWLYMPWFVNTSTGYIVGDAGVILKTTDGGGLFVGVEPYGQSVPAKSGLNGCYPNPFNPSTRISFSINSSNEVGKGTSAKLFIYDVNGREIEKLIDQQMHSGNYSVMWDASGLPSGIYFCHLDTPEYKSSIKLVLIK